MQTGRSQRIMNKDVYQNSHKSVAKKKSISGSDVHPHCVLEKETYSILYITLTN